MDEPKKLEDPHQKTDLPVANEKETSFVPFGEEVEIKLSIGIVKQLLCTPTRTGKVCSDRDAIRFIMLCKARQLNPFQGDAFLVGYDSNAGPQFSMITAHQAFLKRACQSASYDGMESGVIVLRPDGGWEELPGDFVPPGFSLIGGWAKVYIKGQRVPIYRRMNIEARQKLKADGTITAFWANDPAGMIVKCAEGDALRSAFPTTIGGMYLEEEMVPTGQAQTIQMPTRLSEAAVAEQSLRNCNEVPQPANDR